MNNIKYQTKLALVILSFLFFQSAIKAEVNSSTASESDNTSDTLYVWNGADTDNFVFVMKNNKVDIQDLYLIVNNKLKFTTTEVGYFRTKESYSNFKLHAEWRWPENVENGNSGILIYTQQDTVWPQCVQVQLKRDNAGDIIAMNTFVAEAAGKPKDTAVKFNDSNEKPLGQWNECDISCSGGSLEVHINGELQNKVTGIKITNGTIGFQLEGKPIEFRNIYLIKEK